MLAPGAPAALRVCSIICVSCLWRWALCDKIRKETRKIKTVLKKKRLFWIVLEFYSRWQGMLAPGAPAALRAYSIICSSCLWRWALCGKEQFFFNNGFLFKKPLFSNKKRFFLNYFEFYSRRKGLLAPDTKTHFQTASICPMQLLFLLLAVRFGLQMPLEGPRGPKWARNRVFGDVPQVIWPWFITYWLITALPQHPERCSAHFGPSISS